MSEFPLASEFPAADEAAWMALVEKALGGASFEETLVSHTRDGLRLKPLYTRADETGDPGLPGAAPYIRGLRAAPADPPWDIRQLHAHPDPATANAEILADLDGGASSIALQVAAPEQAGVELSTLADLKRVLEGVHLDFAPVSLHAGANAVPLANALQDLWRERGMTGETARGAFNADPLGVLARAGALPESLEQALAGMAGLARGARDEWPNASAVLVDATAYHDAGASEAQELACLCSTLAAYLRALEGEGVAPGEALALTDFRLAADTDQFLTIAKLRAARALIARIAEACGAGGAPARARLNAVTARRMLSRCDPWMNILRTTMAGAAAAMGGAESITVLPFTWAVGLPDAFARRIARNIQIILQEEASLGAVIDPAGGSWYAESLTNALAENAWSQFQDIERRGGMAQALAEGFVQSRIAETAEARARAVATGDEPLIGVSAWPQLGAVPVVTEPHPVADELADPAVTVEPLPARPPSEPFDRLRAAANAHFDHTGKRPCVFLANLGTPADFTARASFAQNFFAAGGVDAVQTEGFDSAEAAAKAFRESGCRLACLCSSDAVYTELAQDVARALVKAEAWHVYLAGRPGDERAALQKAGVGTFIYQGCDMLDVLSDAHDYYGIKAV